MVTNSSSFNKRDAQYESPLLCANPMIVNIPFTQFGGSRSNETDLSSRTDERSARISAICPKETVTVLEKLEPSKCASFIYSIDLSLLFVYIKASSRSHLLVSLGFTLRKSISQGSSSLFWSGGGQFSLL